MNSSASTLLSVFPNLNLVGVVVCLLVILIMLFRWKNSVMGRGLLLFSYIIILYPLLYVYIYSSGNIYHYPHLLRTSAPVSLLYLPTMYLYMRTLATGRSLRWTDALHLLPMLLFIVNFWPFYIQPAVVKQQLVLGDNYWKQYLRFDEGWLLPAYWHHYIRSIQLLVYWLLEVQIIYGLIRRQQADFMAKNRAWFTWMLTLIGLQALLFIPAAGVSLFDWSSTMIKFWYDMSLTLVVCLTCFALLLRPEILYGLQDLSDAASDTPIPPVPSDELVSDTEKLEHYIPPSLISAYDHQIQTFMGVQEAFRKPGYTIREMAEDTGISLHHLSAVINRHYGYHFNEYINQQRIEYLKQQLDKREWKHKTLEALAQESGFSNRTSFIAAFKKHCGTTPSDYVRNLKETS